MMVARVLSSALSDLRPGLRLACAAQPFAGVQGRGTAGAAARGRRAAPHPSPTPAGLGRLRGPRRAGLEVASVLRRQIKAGALDSRRAGLALNDLAALPARRAAHRPLLPRCWELRDNLTIYDAADVALAEALKATLLTGDRRLARAPGPQCPSAPSRSSSPHPEPPPGVSVSDTTSCDYRPGRGTRTYPLSRDRALNWREPVLALPGRAGGQDFALRLYDYGVG